MPPRSLKCQLDLLARLGGGESPGGSEMEVTGLSYDSRLVKKGDLFFALPGHTVDGHDFIKNAAEKGAVAAIVEKRVNENLPQIEVRSSYAALSKISAEFFGRPTESLPVIGVTGTNGKTTVTYLLEGIFHSLGKKCGVMGTVNYRFNGQRRPAPNTTPLPLDIQSFAYDVRVGGGEALIMEVSSHALALERVAEIRFKTAIFTNLTQDHLDFHKDMESYFKAKAKLFSWNEAMVRAVNVDDPYGQRLAEQFPDSITFGLSKGASLRAADVSTDLSGCRFSLHTPSGKKHAVKTNLIGAHNVSNLLAAAGGALAFGLPEAEVVKALSLPFSIPGRLERVEQGQPFVAVVDYAHTPDALEKALKSLRELKPRRLISVFGAGGDRDAGKRPLMGKISAEIADLSFVTSDNPRTENPVKILRDIEAGIPSERKANCRTMEDRKEAILASVQAAGEGDIILVAGKGHEDYQIIGKTKHHFSDKEVLEEAISKCGFQSKN